MTELVWKIHCLGGLPPAPLVVEGQARFTFACDESYHHAHVTVVPEADGFAACLVLLALLSRRRCR